MKFEGEKGDHFFRATLVQTLFYGVFSSWVLWCREHRGRPGARFNWHEAGWTLHVPMVAGLFSQIATPQKLKPLGVDEVLDWAGDVLNRVEQAAFFQKFEEEHAVQYFYEPFLKAYDPELRRNWASGTLRPRSSNTSSNAWTASCARNSTSSTAWPTGRNHSRSMLWHRRVSGRSS